MLRRADPSSVIFVSGTLLWLFALRDNFVVREEYNNIAEECVVEREKISVRTCNQYARSTDNYPRYTFVSPT